MTYQNMESVNSRRLCRLCLSFSAKLVDVFEENCGNGFSVNEVIKDLLQLEVKEEPGLCWLICLTCLGKLDIFRLFKLQCRESNVTYKLRFSLQENKQELDYVINDVSKEVGESNHFPVCGQEHGLNSREEITVKMFTDLALKEGYHEDMTSYETTQFIEKTEDEHIEEVPECKTVIVDWPEISQKGLSSNHGEKIDIDEIDLSRIKAEDTEPEVASSPEKSFLGNHSGTENQKHGETDTVDLSENTWLKVPMKKACQIQTANGKEECSKGDSMEVMDEVTKEDSSLTSKEERLHGSKGGRYVMKDVQHLHGPAVCSFTGHISEGSDNTMTTISLISLTLKNKNSNPDGVQCGEHYHVTDCSKKNGYKIHQNQSISTKEEILLNNSSKILFSEDISKGHSTKESIENAPSHMMITEESRLWNHSRLSPRRRIGRLNNENQSSDEGSKKKVFSCDICRKSFDNKGGLKFHLKSHSLLELFACEICGQQFNEKPLLSGHACNPHLGLSGKLPSELCQPRSSSESSTRCLIDSSQKPFECGICGEGFDKRKNFEDHILMPLGCIGCDEHHDSKTGLLDQYSRLHGESIAMRRCGVCSKKFSLPNLIKHQRSHQKEKRFKCNECGKMFTEKFQLKVHVRVHTGDRPYKCVFCSKCFAQSSNLKEHSRTHSGEKPYTCPKCGQCFSYSRSMRRHFMNHKGLRPYQCKLCGRRFAEKYKLKRHSNTHQRSS